MDVGVPASSPSPNSLPLHPCHISVWIVLGIEFNYVPFLQVWLHIQVAQIATHTFWSRLFEFRAALNEQMCKEKAWKSDESGLFGIQARQAGCYFQVYLARFYELILQEKKQKSHSAPSFNRWLCYL